MVRVGEDEPAPFAVEVRHEVDETVLALTGELDISTVGTLQSALYPLLGGESRVLVFDLGSLSFMDSSGLSELLRAATAGPVRVRKPSQIVRRLIELTGVSTLLPIEQ